MDRANTVHTGARADTASAIRLRSDHWSRRAVEAARDNSRANVRQSWDKSLPEELDGFEANRGRKKAGEVRVQRAAMVGGIAAMMPTTMQGSPSGIRGNMADDMANNSCLCR